MDSPVDREAMTVSDDGVAVLIRKIPHLHGCMLRRKVVDERRRRKGGVKEEVGMGLEVLR